MPHCLIALSVLAAACARPPTVLRLATTTTVEGSGLLEALLPQFEAASKCHVDAVAFGSGQSLSILERGDADVALIHDPDREKQTLLAGKAAQYRKIMFNDFVIAGPAADPAAIRQARGAVDAMQRIAKSGAAFASRGDSSGTHSRELLLWMRAGAKPEGARLIETGQGMTPTLRVASERKAYVLTDRATFTQFAPSLQLVLLFEGSDDLLNTYAVMIRTGLTSDRLAQARAFSTWLADGDGRNAIEAFRARDQQVFHVWPLQAPRDKPDDLPHAR